MEKLNVTFVNQIVFTQGLRNHAVCIAISFNTKMQKNLSYWFVDHLVKCRSSHVFTHNKRNYSLEHQRESRLHKQSGMTFNGTVIKSYCSTEEYTRNWYQQVKRFTLLSHTLAISYSLHQLLLSMLHQLRNTCRKKNKKFKER